MRLYHPLWIFVLLLERCQVSAFVPSTRISFVVGHPSAKRLSARMALLQDAKDENNNEEDAEEEGVSSPGRLRRKRDRIKQWISSGSGSSSSNKSPMVRPIRMEDGTVEEEDDDDDKPRTGSRLKANFDDLFAGMPSMQDILGGKEEEVPDNTSSKTTTTTTPKQPRDDSWFEEERKQIEANYQEIYQEMVAQVQQQRREDPDGVPSNAEAMIQDVLKQEMKTEMEATKEARAKENLDQYAAQQKQEVEAKDLQGVSDPVVDNLIKEDQVIQEREDAVQARIEDYRRYELEAFLKNQKDDESGSGNVKVPDANADLDQWALERYQEMVDTRQSGGNEDDFIVTDLIEDSMEELRQEMEREAGKSSRIQPETLKEWQMYRAIATRLGMQNDATQQLSGDVTEEQIAAQLQSWKDYIAKEGAIREQSGLARGPKLPFEWQESGRDKAIEEAEIKAALESQGGKSKVEIRKEVNRKSIEAMEKLLETSDTIRAERLRKDIAALKQELEANDYLDIDEAALEEEETNDLGPVDISDVFSSTKEVPTAPMPKWNTGNEDVPPIPPRTPFFEDNGNQGKEVDSTPPPPPATPFFAQDDDMDTVQGPPDTPFFSSDQEDVAGSDSGSEYRLGTIEEQKLRAMYQRAGARTEEEKAAIRAQWEEFQQFEKSRRDESGLTDGDDSEMLNKADINYDLSDVTKEDGDIDAAKILASIGPRPTRKRKADSGTPTPAAEGETPPPSSDLDPTEVSDSLYRAVSAVGGGRTRDDPDAKAKEKAAYSEFLEKENEMRESLDGLNDEIASELSGLEGNFDESAYAEDALSSLGARPKPKRRKISEAEYSDKSIALSASDDDDDEDDEEEQGASLASQGKRNDPYESPTPEDDLVPGWLRKERESARSREESSGGRGAFLGSDIDDVFDDDTYEHNQRQLAEYERRRAGGRKQMGIDISDVLGRSSDDYADYNYDDNYFRAKKSGWGTSGFDARKSNFLEYTELNVVELNSLMDHKDSVHSTGMSQYLPRINKPFREFGAIFRLEGVLIDTTGLQYEAWTRVAKEKGFRIPSLEEVRRASVLRSDVAVREAFFWTDDFLLCREIAAAHQRALEDVFNEWMKDSSISPPPSAQAESGRGSLAIGEETTPRIQPVMDPKLNVDESEQMKLLADAWSRTAVTHRLATPSRDQLQMASLVSPEIAVKQAFHWSEDQSKIDEFVATYRSIMEDLVGKPNGDSTKAMPSKSTTKTTAQQPQRVLDENAMMEIQFEAWSQLAEENGFEMPLPDEVLAAVVINDPEIAIRDGFGWTDDEAQLPDLVASYRQSLATLVDEFKGEASTQPKNTPPQVSRDDENQSAVSDDDDGKRPTQEEMLEMQDHAWKSAALNHGFQAPPSDQLDVAMGMSVAEAVTRLFGWTSDEAVIQAVCSTFDSALKDISQKYIRKYGLKRDAILFPNQQKAAAVSSSTPTKESDDVSQVVWDSWSAVAKKKRLSAPDEYQVLFAMSVGPEEAVISGFEWASDPTEVNKIVETYKAELQKRSKRGRFNGSTPKPSQATNESPPPFSVVPGAEKWLRSLLDVEMQCSVVSHMNRQQLDVLLEVSGLSQLFGADKRVTSSDNYGREMDQLLGAALRLERRPDHCVVFDTSPNAAVAAHDVEMRNVAVIGPFPRYELLAADSTAVSFDELTAMNIRRLFSERVYDQPMVDMQQADPEKNTRTKTKFFWDDD